MLEIWNKICSGNSTAQGKTEKQSMFKTLHACCYLSRNMTAAADRGIDGMFPRAVKGPDSLLLPFSPSVTLLYLLLYTGTETG